LFVSLLDEKQRRLFAGLESLQFGHGGDSWIADLLGLDPRLVKKAYKNGIKISDTQFSQLSMQRHTTLPKWNYTLLPRKM